MSCSLRIYHINDCYELENFKYFSTARRDVSNTDFSLCIGVLPGDFIAPSLLSQLDKGYGKIDCMNHGGIDFCCIGNHESDIELSDLHDRISQSRFTWVNSNMQSMPLRKGLHTPEYSIIEVNGALGGCDDGVLHTRRVGILGYITDDPTILRKGAFGGATIEPVVTTKTKYLYDRLIEEEKCDVVIFLTHQDVEVDEALAEMCIGARLVLGGHEHEPFLKTYSYVTQSWTDCLSNSHAVSLNNNDCMIVKTGMDGTMIARCDIVWPTPSATAPTINVDLIEAKSYAADPSMERLISLHQQVLVELERSYLFKITDDMALSSKKMRLEQTTMGSFICTAVRKMTKSDICIFTGGSIRGNRDYIGESCFTYAHLKTEIPFSDDCVVVSFSGQRICDAITYTRHFSLENPTDERGCYIQTDDLVVWNSTTNKVTHIAGEPIDYERMYFTAINPKILNGLDNIEPLMIPNLKLDGIAVKELIVSHFSKEVWLQILSEACFEDIDADKGGTISKDELYMYAKTKFTGQGISRMLIDNLFAIVDDDNDDQISRTELKRLFSATNSAVEKVGRVKI